MFPEIFWYSNRSAVYSGNKVALALPLQQCPIGNNPFCHDQHFLGLTHLVSVLEFWYHLMFIVILLLSVLTNISLHLAWDFGVDELEDIVRDTDFPWMISNVIDNFTGQPLADGLVTRMVTCQDKKVKCQRPMLSYVPYNCVVIQNTCLGLISQNIKTHLRVQICQWPIEQMPVKTAAD